VHNTKELRCRRSLENFPEIITRLAGMTERFATTVDCADISFLPDGMLAAVPARRHGLAGSNEGLVVRPRVGRAAVVTSKSPATVRPRSLTASKISSNSRNVTGAGSVSVVKADRTSTSPPG
jgi:hypothetical protein